METEFGLAGESSGKSCVSARDTANGVHWKVDRTGVAQSGED